MEGHSCQARREYFLTESESKIIDEIRKEKQQNTGGQYLSFSVTVWFANRHLAHHDLDTGNVIMELAELGVNVRDKLSNTPVLDQIQLDEIPEIDDGVAEIESENVFEDDEADLADGPEEWDDVKRHVIPPSVKEVAFTLDQSDATPELLKTFNKRFPGVIIHHHGSPKTSLPLADMVDRSVQTTPEPQSRNKTALGISASSTNEMTAQSSRFLSSPLRGLISQSSPELTDQSLAETILSTAESLKLTVEDPDAVVSMYVQWAKHGSVPAFRKERSMKDLEKRLRTYYINIVDLYIIADRLSLPDLQYRLLLIFQATNHSQRDGMPHIEAAVKTYQYLPTTAPLCRWVTITYGFLWATHEGGTYEELRKDNQDMDTEAFAKFCHSIAYIRCEFTRGHDVAVLERWCEVHSHQTGSEQEKLCQQNRRKHQSFLEKAKQDAKQVEINEAREILGLDGPQRGTKRGNSSGSRARPAKKRKTKGNSNGSD